MTLRPSEFASTMSVESAFSVLAVAKRLKAAGKDVIELEIGDSPFPSTAAAKRAGIGVPGRWRTGLTLTPRGEFSIVIAGLAVGAGVEPLLAPLATAYVLITVIAGPLLARIPDAQWFKDAVRRRRLTLEARAAAGVDA